MRSGFLIGRSAHCTVASAHAVIAGKAGQSGLAEMISQQFRLICRQFGEAFFERACDALMQVPPPPQKQTFVSGVAHQSMLETEALFGTTPLWKNDSCRDQLHQRGLELGPAPWGDSVKQRDGELPTNDGGDLRHLACFAETLEARHQRILERRWHRGAVFPRRFHHALGQFLGEQRHAVGLGDDRGDGFRRQAVCGGDGGDQLRAFSPAQSGERQQGRVRPRQPRGCKIHPRGYQEKQPRLSDAVGDARQQFERGRVNPMSVFHDQKHRLSFAQANDLIDQERNRRGFPLRRRQR